MWTSLRWAALGLVVGSSASAQQLALPDGAADDTAALAEAMPRLAEHVLGVYRATHDPAHLDTLFRLQLVAHRYASAARTLAALHTLQAHGAAFQASAATAPFEIFARAKAEQRREGSRFDDAYQRAFRAAIRPLSDQRSALVIRTLGIDQSFLHQDLRDRLQQQRGTNALSLADAMPLIRAYQVADNYRAFMPHAAALIAEDDRRRYVIDTAVQVRTSDGGTICAVVVRPRAVRGRVPTLLTLTIYANAHQHLFDARRSASNGYAGVVGLTRGKSCSPDTPVPYERDGADAVALIDWISAQPWSDGRVGMYGGSYSGGTAWAAAKRMPKGLKAMMIGAPVAPGIDVPMEGNVVWNFVYPWPFYTTNVKGLDDSTYADSARWNRLSREWYTSGRAYRDLDKIDGTPNPIFDRWLQHPSYDAYWQSMIPYQEEFARVTIPVLTTAGYYSGGQGAAVYYFAQHQQYDPKADHYLLIGPYDHFIAQRGTAGTLGGATRVIGGYPLDPAAQIDMFDLRYRWFNYVLKGGPKPAELQDKVNYQVTGANVWKHAPTLAAMANQMRRFHLSAVRAGTGYGLTERGPTDAAVPLTVNLADRGDVDRVVPDGFLDTAIDTAHAIEFISDPLPAAVEVSGLLSGRLDFVTNKKDFDVAVTLYEMTPRGEYFLLAPYWARASYTENRSDRRLLTPGERRQLNFRSGRLMSHRLQPGSRIVMVLGVVKDPGRQINYGTGKDVSDETIADAGAPLQITWFTDSYIDVPVWR